MVENDPWLPVMGKETGTLVEVPASLEKPGVILLYNVRIIGGYF